MSRRRLLVGVLVVALAATPVFAQWVVFDPTNYIAAIDRLIELQRHYVQLVETYRQIREQYDHMVRMARQVPVVMATRYKALAPAWRFSVGTDTYGTAGGWTATVNTGDRASDGYRLATQALRDYGTVFSSLPLDEQARIRAQYATVELADASTILGIQTVGRVRWRGPSLEGTVQALEDDSLSSADAMNTEIAVLNKINAAGVLGLRTAQSTNQLLVSLLEDRMIEAKRQREAEVGAINAHVTFVTQARPYLQRVSAGTTAVVTSAIIP